MTKIITELEVLDALTESSHQTYMTQKAEDLRRIGQLVPKLDPNPTDHDRERARNAVTELKKLGFKFPYQVE